MTTLVERIVAIGRALDESRMPWALGGAIALAYATEEPRGTRGIDVNVFVATDHAHDVFEAMPDGVRHGPDDISTARRDGQVRLWWDDTPVDIFFAAAPFHHTVEGRCRPVPFADTTIRVLAPEDLAVFKAMFDRPKDWVDIMTMAESRAIDLDVAADRLESLLGDDPRVGRLRHPSR